MMGLVMAITKRKSYVYAKPAALISIPKRFVTTAGIDDTLTSEQQYQHYLHGHAIIINVHHQIELLPLPLVNNLVNVDSTVYNMFASLATVLVIQ